MMKWFSFHCCCCLHFTFFCRKTCFLFLFCLLSKTRRENNYPALLQTTGMMKGTVKKLNDQTTWCEHRKKMTKINEPHNCDLQETFLWLEFVCFSVTISNNLFSDFSFPQMLFLPLDFYSLPEVWLTKINTHPNVLKHFFLTSRKDKYRVYSCLHLVDTCSNLS